MAKTKPKPTTEKEMDVSLTVKLPSELRDKARNKSRETGVSLSFIVRKALENWIANGTSQRSKQ